MGLTILIFLDILFLGRALTLIKLRWVASFVVPLSVSLRNSLFVHSYDLAHDCIQNDEAFIVDWHTTLKVKWLLFIVPLVVEAVFSDYLSDFVQLIYIWINWLHFYWLDLSLSRNLQLNEAVPSIAFLGLDIVNDGLIFSLVLSRRLPKKWAHQVINDINFVLFFNYFFLFCVFDFQGVHVLVGDSGE